ncbi:MAG: nitroreductase family protein [Gammaproteobacteria bacterium]|nr:nitroreductase family protein [Gammaproteobacteria bacterium]HJL96047.1 nitroreductase [SAR86 cluster bacterium]|tara:strand:- start:7052 stop:7711 length:660 start_codon:yes stop_codon:yes gene_type:complete
MDVTEAVDSRKSIRAFLDKAVDDSVIKELLEKSSRAASGGNLQPWQIYVINGKTMKSFHNFQSEWTEPETPAYAIYPENLKEPYKTSRYEVADDMYSLLGIVREDKEARLKQVLKNYDFFGAPAAFFCFVDRQMGRPQWSDLGMFLQTFMLLAREAGLDTCPQEAWAMKQESVTSFVEAPEELILFCGMAIGYQDESEKVNELRTTRRPIEDWTTFLSK